MTSISAASPSFGTDLTLAEIYFCDTRDLHEATVKECSSHYPSLAHRAAVSWEGWLRRNEGDAKKAKRLCLDVMQGQQKGDEAQKAMEQMKKDILLSLPQMIKTQGEAFCRHYLASLENSKNDLTHLLNKPEK